MPVGFEILMRTVVHWNTASLRSLTVEARTDFPVAGSPGLQFRVTADHHKSWAYIYKRKADRRNRRVTIGSFPEIGLREARDASQTLRVRVRNGEDPAGEVSGYKVLETVNDLIDRYLKDYAIPKKRTAGEDQRILDKDVRPRIGGFKASMVTRKDVLAIINAVKDRGAGVGANRTKAVISKMFAWAVQEGHVASNPATDIAQRVKETAKDRALNPAEIAAFWHGLDASGLSVATKTALKLALITGQRIGEVCSAEIKHVDLVTGVWDIPSLNTKNNKRHVLPLSSLAIELFAGAKVASSSSKFFFPSNSETGHLESHSLSTAMRRARTSLGLDDYPATPHDLRRTVATQMAGQGAPEDIVSKILNHSQGSKQSVTGKVYIQFDFMKEKRTAMDEWSARLASIIAKVPN